MTEGARREYAEVLRAQYRPASKQKRGKILDEYCCTTGGHRKAATRWLRGGPPRSGLSTGRPRRYGRELLPLLERVWQGQ